MQICCPDNPKQSRGQDKDIINYDDYESITYDYQGEEELEISDGCNNYVLEYEDPNGHYDYYDYSKETVALNDDEKCQNVSPGSKCVSSKECGIKGNE